MFSFFFSLSHSLIFIFSLYLPIYISLTHSLSLSLCISVSLSLCLSVSLSLCLSLSLSPSLPLSLSPSLLSPPLIDLTNLSKRPLCATPLQHRPSPSPSHHYKIHPLRRQAAHKRRQPQGLTTLSKGCTPKGSYSPRGGVLSTFWISPSQNPFSEPFSKPFLNRSKTHSTPPSQNSSNPSQNLPRTLLKTPCCRTTP